MEKLLIIADDMTGACDSAAYAAQFGWNPRVIVNAQAAGFCINNSKAVILNAQTRTLPRDEAYEKVKELAMSAVNNSINGNKIDLLIKKIDTAFRGNVGAEIEAMLEGSGMSAALVINAIPELNRVTFQGTQLINGKRISETQFANDPLNPVTESYIPHIIHKTSNIEVKTICLEDIRSGNFLKEQHSQENEKRVVLVFDAVTQEDIRIITEGLYEQSDRYLWVGSLGLIKELIQISSLKNNIKSAGNRAREKATDREIIVGVSGSTNSKTREQIEYARKHKILDVITLEAEVFLEQTNYVKHKSQIINRIRTILDKGKFIFIIPEIIKDDIYFSDRHKISNQIIFVLSDLVKTLVDAYKLKSLLLIGGETSYGIFDKLGISSLGIMGSIDTAIVEVNIEEAGLKDTMIVLKGGSIGEKEAIAEIFDYIERGIPE